MSTTITTRIEDSIVKDIDEIALKEAIDRSSVIRKFLLLSLKEWKIQKALEEYEKGTITLWKAAKECGITLWEMILEVQKRGTRVPYGIDELKEDLKSL